MPDGTDVGGAYVEIRPDLTGFRQELEDGLKADTAGIDQHVAVRIDADAENFDAEVARVKAERDEMNKQASITEFKGDADDLDAKIRTRAQALKAFGAQKPTVVMDGDTRPLQAKLDDIVARVDDLSHKVYDIKVRPNDELAKAELAKLQEDADHLSTKAYNLRVGAEGVDTTLAELEALEAKASDVERAADGAAGSGGGGGGLAGLGSAGESASAGLSPLVGVAAGLAPALIPIGAAATAALGGILSLATGAGAGLAGVGIVSADVLGKVFSAVSNLQTAQQKYNAAVASGNKAGEKTALQQETAAYVGLDAGQRKAAESLVALKDQFHAFTAQFQPQVFDLFNQGLKLASGLMKDFAPIIKGSFTALDGLAAQFEKAVSGPGGAKFIKFLTTEAPLGITVFGKALLSIGEGFAGIVEAFGPFSKILGAGIDEAAAKFAKFGQSLAGSSGFKSFMEYVKQNGPVIGAFFKELVVVAGQLLVALAPLGTAILKVFVLTAPAIVAAVKLIGDFARAIAALMTIALPVFKAVDNGIATVIDYLAKLFSSGKNLEQGLGQVWSGIKTGASAAWQAILSVTRTVWGAIESFFSTVWADIRGVFTSSLAAVRNALNSVWSDITGAIHAVWTAIKAFFQSVWAEIVGIFTSSTGRITGTLTGTWSSIAGTIHATWSAIVGFFSSTWGAIEGVFSAGIGAVVGFMSSLPGRAMSAVSALVGDMQSVASSAMSAFLNAIEQGAAAAVGYVGGIPGQIIGAFGSLAGQMFAIGENIMGSMARGIAAAAGSVASAAGDAASRAFHAATSFLGIHSPSTLFHEMGVNVALGLAQGIAGGSGAAVAASQAMAQAVTAAGRPSIVGGSGHGAGGGAWSGTSGGFANNASWNPAGGAGAWGGTSGSFANNASWRSGAATGPAVDPFRDVTPAIIASVSSLLGQMRTVALDKGQQIIDAMTTVTTRLKNGTFRVSALPGNTVLDQAQIDAIASRLPKAIGAQIEKAGPLTVSQLKSLFAKLNADVPLSDINAIAKRLPSSIVAELEKAGPLTVAKFKSLADSLTKALNTAGDDLAKGLRGSMAQLTTYVGDAQKEIDKNFKGTQLQSIVDALGRNFDYLSSKAKTSLASITSQLSAAQAGLASIRQTISQNASSLEGQFNITQATGTTFTNPFNGSTWTAPLSGGNIIATLQADVKSLKTYKSLLDTLKGWGLSNELLAQLVAAGPAQGLATAQALVAGGKKEVDLADSLQGQIDSTSTQIATISATAVIGGKQVGLSQAEGIVNGLTASKAKVTAELKTLAKDMQSVVEQALDITGSSSGVFKGVGEKVIKGLLDGIKGTSGPLKAELEQVTKSLEDALGIHPAAGHAGAAGGGSVGTAWKGGWGDLAGLPKPKQKALSALGGGTLPGGSGGGVAPVTITNTYHVTGDVGPATVKLIKQSQDAHDKELMRWIGRF